MLPLIKEQAHMIETATETLIEAKKIGKRFLNGRLETTVLCDIDLQIKAGEFVALMGPSGCGKSTLMHVLGLMLAPSAGELFIEGTNAAGLSEAARAQIRRDKLGFVFQRFNLLPTVNAYQNIAIAEQIRGRGLNGQVREALAAVDMTGHEMKKPGQLSIGQQQRVAIARAIVHRPKVLLADEPTGNLDSHHTEQILGLFQEIHQRYGITIIMITHSEFAAQWAQRIIHMADGRILHAH